MPRHYHPPKLKTLNKRQIFQTEKEPRSKLIGSKLSAYLCLDSLLLLAHLPI
jgi:hypothetical protein